MTNIPLRIVDQIQLGISIGWDRPVADLDSGHAGGNVESLPSRITFEPSKVRPVFYPSHLPFLPDAAAEVIRVEGRSVEMCLWPLLEPAHLDALEEIRSSSLRTGWQELPVGDAWPQIGVRPDWAALSTTRDRLRVVFSRVFEAKVYVQLVDMPWEAFEAEEHAG